jgi:hypothetical protein
MRLSSQTGFLFFDLLGRHLCSRINCFDARGAIFEFRNFAERIERRIGEEVGGGFDEGTWAQPVFLTQNLHQPAGLISPSTSVQEFGSWNREQLLHC